MSIRAIDLPSHYAVRSRFDDFEAFREAMAAWDLDLRQLDPGPLDVQLLHVASPKVLLSRSSFSRRMDQNGTSPRGFRTFGIPAQGRVHLRWRGRECDGDSLMLFPRGGELDSVSEAGFQVYTLSVSEAALQQATQRRELPGIDDLFGESRLITPPTHVLSSLRRLAGDLTRSSVEDPDLLASAAFIERWEFDLLEAVFDAVTGGRITDSRPMACSRSRVLRKALEIIRFRAGEPVTVGELCNLTGASMRSLRYAFEEEFALSPKQFLQTYRLGHVRRELRTASISRGAISDIANRWGFWHMGQFARDYRKMFGELPSDTLHRQT